MWWNRLFLVKVFKKNKFLFLLFWSFIAGSFYFNYKGVETTPFFIWAMFAGKMEPKAEYKIVTVSYNDGKTFNLPHTFNEPRSMMVYFTLNHYRKIDANRMEDPMKDVLSTVLPRYPFLVPYAERLVTEPEENKRYLQWLKDYLSSIIGETVNNATVYERLVHFTTGGKVEEDGNRILYTIQ